MCKINTHHRTSAEWSNRKHQDFAYGDKTDHITCLQGSRSPLGEHSTSRQVRMKKNHNEDTKSVTLAHNSCSLSLALQGKTVRSLNSAQERNTWVTCVSNNPAALQLPGGCFVTRDMEGRENQRILWCTVVAADTEVSICSDSGETTKLKTERGSYPGI